MKTFSKWLIRAATVVTVFAVILVVGVWRSSRSLTAEPTTSAIVAKAGTIPRSRPQNALKSGRNIQVVFIGSSTCGASNQPEVAEAIKVLRARLERIAKESNARISFVGVATDQVLSAGLGFLSEFGPFDEVVVGGNWLNSAVVRFIWRDVPGAASMPQIVVVEQTVEMLTNGLTVSGDKLLARKAGIPALVEWSKRESLL